MQVSQFVFIAGNLGCSYGMNHSTQMRNPQKPSVFSKAKLTVTSPLHHDMSEKVQAAAVFPAPATPVQHGASRGSALSKRPFSSPCSVRPPCLQAGSFSALSSPGAASNGRWCAPPAAAAGIADMKRLSRPHIIAPPPALCAGGKQASHDPSGGGCQLGTALGEMTDRRTDNSDGSSARKKRMQISNVSGLFLCFPLSALKAA